MLFKRFFDEGFRGVICNGYFESRFYGHGTINRPFCTFVSRPTSAGAAATTVFSSCPSSRPQASRSRRARRGRRSTRRCGCTTPRPPSAASWGAATPPSRGAPRSWCTCRTRSPCGLSSKRGTRSAPTVPLSSSCCVNRRAGAPPAAAAAARAAVALAVAAGSSAAAAGAAAAAVGAPAAAARVVAAAAAQASMAATSMTTTTALRWTTGWGSSRLGAPRRIWYARADAGTARRAAALAVPRCSSPCTCLQASR